MGISLTEMMAITKLLSDSRLERESLSLSKVPNLCMVHSEIPQTFPWSIKLHDLPPNNLVTPEMNSKHLKVCLQHQKLVKISHHIPLMFVNFIYTNSRKDDIMMGLWTEGNDSGFSH